MKTSIKEMLKFESNQEKNFLELKRDLLAIMKTGEIFIKEDLTMLSEEDPFTIYSYLAPGNDADENAFPMFLGEFLNLPKSEEGKEEALLFYYSEYYDEEAEKDHFKKFRYHVHRAGEFVWFYHE